MTAADEVFSLIMQDIKPLPEGVFREAVIDEILEQIPSYESFLHPAPDVVDDIEKIPSSIAKCLLGAYVPMSSPGLVALFSHNMRVFFWGLVRDSQMVMPKLTKAGSATNQVGRGYSDLRLSLPATR